MDFYKNLVKNRNSYTGRLNMAIFYTIVFLLLVHIFLTVFYLVIGHKLMIIVNLVSLLYYILGVRFAIKYKWLFLRICFIEIWAHTLLGIMCFGWDGYYQNWIFALLVAVFLPAFNPTNYKQSYKYTFFFSFILLLSYLLFAYIVNTYTFSFTVELSLYMKNFMFAMNNLIAFSAIIMFAITYTKNKESKELELLRRANFDELTGIYNRHGIDTIELALLENSKIYSVGILDIDFFKPVNDSFGHKSGDLVLKKIGKILESYTSKTISVGRWGGEEFLIIGNADIDYKDYVKILERIRVEISNTKFIIKNKKKINITVSIGAKHIKDGKPIEEAVTRADANLYKAKKSGRNKVVS